MHIIGEQPDAGSWLDHDLAAALDLITRDGIGEASMAAIARHAGASKETLYRFFGDRRGLLEAVIDRVFPDMSASLPFDADDVDLAKPIDESLRSLGRAYLRATTTPVYIAALRAVIVEDERNSGLGRVLVERIMDRLVDHVSAIMEQYVKAGLIEVVEPRLAAGMFMGLLQGKLRNRLLLGGDVPEIDYEIEQHVLLATRVFLNGMRSQPVA